MIAGQISALVCPFLFMIVYMNETQTNKISIGRRFWNFIFRGWIAEVPDDIACCEFNCRELNCDRGKWETCENRLRYIARLEEYRTKAAKLGSAEHDK